MNRNLLAGVTLALVASSLFGAGSLAYFSDVELAKNTFTAGVFDLQLDYNGDWYNGEPIIWETPINWMPGETEGFCVSLHMRNHKNMGREAKSLIVHFDVEVRENYEEPEPELVADPTGTVNDLDSVIEVTKATFKKPDNGEINILGALKFRFDKNGDGELKLSELDCEQWDVLSFGVMDEINSLEVCKVYNLNFDFTFETDAENEYQGDRIVVKTIITALQEQWEESGGDQIKPVEKSMLLVEKDENWNINWDGAWGEIMYKDEYSPGEMQLILQGLTANNWYLVTFQAGDWWDGSKMPDSGGIFGHKTDDNTEWIDVALVQTDVNGDANVMIPTVSGVTSADLNDPDPYNTDPLDILPTGDYTCAVVVKDVGPGADHPGWDGPPSLTNPNDVLFETELISFEIT